MIVISDTSPLNYLAIIGNAPVLHALFGEVIIPPAVAHELAHERAPDATRALVDTPPPWLVVRAPDASVVQHVRATTPRLGMGELEAISLAKELNAELLLTDERRATREAREQYRLRVTGLLGVLELAALRDLIDLPAAIARLGATTFRAPRATLERLLDNDAARRLRRK